MTDIAALTDRIKAFVEKTQGSNDINLKHRRAIMSNRLTLLADEPTDWLIASTAKDMTDNESYLADPAEWKRRNRERG